jgi:hypothetical protein
MIWERNGDAFYATDETLSGEVCFRLIVEMRPDETWDWAAWRDGGRVELARHGVIETAQAAIQAAELAVSLDPMG